MAFFRKFWAYYAVGLFILLMIICLPVILVNSILASGELALRRNIAFLHHRFTPAFLALTGIRLRVKGLDNLDRNQSYVIVSNHRSSLDFIVNAAAFPGIFRFLAKKELLKIPVFGWVVGKMCLMVDRSSPKNRAESMLALQQALREGWSIFIYPEGGRNQGDAPLAPFFDGAFRVAIQTQAPLLVQTLVNIHEISAKAKSVDLQPGVVTVCWDGPINTKNLTEKDIPGLKARVREIMESHLQQQP